MKVSDCLSCAGFPCGDVRHDCFSVPNVDLDPAAVRIAMIAEAAPAERHDGFYAGPDALYARTTLASFAEAGYSFDSLDDLLARGIYLTSAVKCAKTGYLLSTPTIRQCSLLLEQELALFPNLRALLLMGDVAIKALNAIAARNGEPRLVPAGPTYKIRGGEYSWRGLRVYPSYLQAGPSFFIEKGKHRVVAQDITAALTLVGA